MKKLNIGLIAASGVLVTGLASSVLWNGVANGEWDFPGLNQQVQHLTEQGDNHEARITNLEGQANTPADQPTPTPQVVTKVVTQAAPQSAGVVAGANATPTPVVTPAPYVMSYYLSGCNSTLPYTAFWSDGTKTTQNTQPATGVDKSTSSVTICK